LSRSRRRPSRAPQQQLALYFRDTATAIAVPSGDETTHLLSPEPPAGETQESITAGLAKADATVVAQFWATAPHLERIGVAPSSVVLYLASHNTSIDGCAGVHVELTRVGAQARTVLAVGSASPTILPVRTGGLTSPTVIPLATAASGWTLAAGDVLSLTIAAQNDCGEYRGVELFYDAVSQASRLVFPDDAASRPAFVDNCPTVANPRAARRRRRRPRRSMRQLPARGERRPGRHGRRRGG
jgi:hypothetical protein